MANQAHLDALAQKLGFQNYAQYSAYQQHQALMRQQPAAPVAAQPAPQPQPQQNWLQNLINNYTPLGSAMERIRKVL